MMVFVRVPALLFVLVSFFSQNFAAKPAERSVNPEKLYLRQLLTRMHDIATVYDKEEPGTTNHLSSVSFVITLFDNIVDDFNRGALATNQEIKYKFVNMCNYLKLIEDVQPRHLRMLKKQIQKFDDYVKKFCLRRKKYLTQQDLDLFNRITQFNQFMSEGLLKADYLDIDGYDQCVDWFIYRPWEFVKEHKTLVGLTLLAASVAVGYYYAFPWLQTRFLANENQQLNVRQLPCIIQEGNTCPYHALYNYMCMRDANGNINRMQVLMNDRERFNQFFNNCTNYLGTQGAVDAEGIESLVRNNLIVQGDNTGLVIVPNADALQNIDGLNNYRFIGNTGQITHARQSFNNNQRQYFIINTTPLAGQENNTTNLGGHWVTVGMIPFDEPQAIVTDSVGAFGINRNITREQYINQIHDILTQPLENN